LFRSRKQSIFVQYSYQPAKSPANEVIDNETTCQIYPAHPVGVLFFNIGLCSRSRFGQTSPNAVSAAGCALGGTRTGSKTV
jgi:hypothetical protein